MLFPSNYRPNNLPPRLPGGLPPNFKGIEEGKDKLADYIEKKAGGVAIDPLGVAYNTLTLDSIPKKVLAGIRGFFGFEAYEKAPPVNKFTLRGAANFTGSYPMHLIAERMRNR